MRRLRLTILAMITAGLVLIGYGAWDLFGNVANVNASQSQLEQAWSLSPGEQVGTASASALVEPPKPLPGNAIARMSIPSLHQQWIVVEGTSLADIATAPGHYSFSAMPGQRGNFAVAGHREPGVFWDLDKLRKGDLITVETRKTIYTYVVTRNFITSPQSWPEVSATPPGFGAGTKVLTLTTCNPKWDNYERLVIHAVIQS
jgi:LPXTG-site transpeptidase (sortase) family protein